MSSVSNIIRTSRQSLTSKAATALAAAAVSIFAGSARADLYWDQPTADLTSAGNWANGWSTSSTGGGTLKTPTGSDLVWFNGLAGMAAPNLGNGGGTVKGIEFTSSSGNVTFGTGVFNSTPLSIGSLGIVLDNGAGNVTFSYPSLNPTTSQNWTNNSSSKVLLIGNGSAKVKLPTSGAPVITLGGAGAVDVESPIGAASGATSGSIVIDSNATVTIGGAYTATGGMTVNSGAKVFGANGTALGGSAGLTINDRSTFTHLGNATAMVGSGAVTVNGNFTYDGTASGWTAGVLTAAASVGGDLGTGNMNLGSQTRTITVLGTPLADNQVQTGSTPGNLVIKNTIQSGGLIKDGAGSLVLTKPVTYTGDTVVKQGLLSLGWNTGGTWGGGTASLATSANIIVGDTQADNGAKLVGVHATDLTIANQTLAGFGTVHADGTGAQKVLIGTNGHIAPGNGSGANKIGILTVDNIALGSQSGSLLFDLGSTAGSNDALHITGTATVNNLQWSDFAFAATGAPAGGNYTLLQNDNAIGGTGLLAGSLTGTIGGVAAELKMDGNNVILSVVPEPTMIGLGAGVAAMGLLGRRRRQAATA